MYRPMYRLSLAACVLAMCFGCGKKGEKGAEKPTEPARAAPVAAPEKPGPEKTAAAVDIAQPPPVPEKKSPVPELRGKLTKVAGADGVGPIGELRKYAAENPDADDAADARSLAVTTAVTLAAGALEKNEAEVARQLLGTVAAPDGTIAGDLAKAIPPEELPVYQTVARFVAAGALEDLPRLSQAGAGAGPLAAVARRIAEARAVPFADAFSEEARKEGDLGPLKKVEPLLPQGGEWKLCPEVRGKQMAAAEGCDPGYYGLADKAQMAGLSTDALAVLRVSALARLAGEKAPKGMLDLPLAESTAPELRPTADAKSRVMPLETVTVDAAGVHLTMRPVAQLEAETLPSSGPWPGPVAFTKEDLDKVLEIKIEKKQDEALQPLVDALAAHRTRVAPAEKAVYGEESKETNSAAPAGKLAALFVADKDLEGKYLKLVLRALDLAGYADIRYLRGEAEREVLPAPNKVEHIPEARQGRPERRPLLVHVKKDSADVFPAAGGKGRAEVEASDVELPKGLFTEKEKEGKGVFRYSVRTTEIEPVVQTVRHVRKRSASGTVIVVVPDDDTPADRVLAVASAIAGAEGPAQQTKVSEVFPGMVCKDEDPEAGSEACRSLFPVIADYRIPYQAGEKVEKPPPIKLGFCSEKNIAGVIRSRAGAFKFCYQRRLQLKQDLEGKVIVRLIISESGAVESATSSGTMPDQHVHECVLNHVRKLTFKPPEGAGKCIVRWPFQFSPDT